MRKTGLKTAMVLAAILLLATLIIHHSRREEADTEAEKSAAAPAAAASNPLSLTPEEISQAGIRIEPVQSQTLNALITLTGTITANKDRIAEVSPRLAGRVVSVAVALGTRVESGQTLAMLDSIDLGQARADYLQARSEATVAEATLSRAEGLVAERIVPKKDYLRAKADAERARAAAQAAADKLQLLGVSPKVVGEQYNAAYPLAAPFAGTVIEKKAVLGKTAQPDQSLFTIADLTSVWLEADVFEQDLGSISLGASALVAVAAYPDAAFTGVLTYLGDTMDTTTRTVKARVELPNPEGKLKPGMFATAHLHSTVNATSLAVPQKAVLLVQGQSSVFVATAQGFALRAVETGDAVDGWLTVRAGLEAGEKIVVSGAYTLKARLLKSQIGTDND